MKVKRHWLRAVTCAACSFDPIPSFGNQQKVHRATKTVVVEKKLLNGISLKRGRPEVCS